MEKITTRKKALEILDRSEKAGRYSSDLLAREARSKDLNYGLLQTLVKGVLQWRSRLDSEIDRLWPEKVELQPNLRNVLRMAAYQLMFLERVPAQLIENETLRLAKEVGGRRQLSEIRNLLENLGPNRSSEGFVTEKAPEVKLSELKTADQIAQHFSHPLWIVERWIKEFGLGETKALCAANNRPWPVCIRTNLLRLNTEQLRKNLQNEGVRYKPARIARDCTLITKLPKGVRLTSLDAFKAGYFQVQDESAALISMLLNPKSGSTVLDLCAAPGGKATHLAELMHNKGRLLAVDRDAKRLKLVEENTRRLGLRIIRTYAADATALELKELADYVLLDAPCSGLGVLGRKSDLRWARGEENIAELAALQKKLLWQAAKLVRPGGRLVYSTCTVEWAENEEVVREFLKAHPDFRLQEDHKNMPDELFTKKGFFRTFPHRHQMGGAFAALLERIR